MHSAGEPGAIDDLITDAEAAGHQASPRLITDWVSLGLLDKPARRSLGQGRGSNKALYSGNQRKLLLVLLNHRKNVRSMATIAKVPVALWVYYGDDYVPLRQARRAIRTWLGDYRASRERAEWAAREMLGQLDNPAATPKACKHLRQVLAHIAYTGELDLTVLEDAITEVFEPQISPLRRAIGPPGAFLTADIVITLMQARLTAARIVKNGQVSDKQLQLARQVQIAERAAYDVLQPQLSDQAGSALTGLFKPVTFEEKVNACCVDLLTLIGLQLRNQ